MGVIAKFSLDGRFEEYFQEFLVHPRCICVNPAGFVFVTLGNTTQTISVFHPGGDMVTMFGLHEDWLGCGRGGLRRPVGITVDEDGFIYVCNTQSNEIVVF